MDKLFNATYFEPDIVRDGEHEYRRLKKKVKDYVKKNLRDYITEESMVGRKGKKLVKIPIRGVRLPNFERDRRKTGGVGQGEGEPGKPLPGQGRPKPGQGPGAGTDPGEHPVEIEIDVEEVLDILQEALELPNIEDKGKRRVESTEIEYTDLRKTGPDSLLDKKRTLKNALIRTLCGAPVSPDKYPEVVIEKDDKVFKTWEEIIREETNAVVIAVMDISGSMGSEQKNIVATTMYWIEEWLKKQYKKSIEVVHIVHDTRAWEVSYDDFYRIQSGGGTQVSPALELCDKIIQERFPVSDWNIYPFFFSDGDNYPRDNERVANILENHILPKSNQVAYGQVQNNWGEGELYNFLVDKLGHHEKLCVHDIKRNDEILGAIKKFLGRGR